MHLVPDCPHVSPLPPPLISLSLSLSRTFSSPSGPLPLVVAQTQQTADTHFLGSGYEVVQMEHRSNQNAEDGKQIDGPFYLWAPNEDAGHGYVCAHNEDCQVKGDEWWGHKSTEDTVFNEDNNAVGPSAYVWKDVQWQ